MLNAAICVVLSNRDKVSNLVLFLLERGKDLDCQVFCDQMTVVKRTSPSVTPLS